MSKLTDLRGQLDAVRKKMADVFAEAGEDMDMDKVKSVEGDSAAIAAQIKAWNDEMTDLGTQIEEFEAFDGMKTRTDKLSEVQKHPGHPKAGENGQRAGEENSTERKGFGDLFVESPALTTKGVEATFDNVNLKALFESTTGWVPYDVRSPHFVDYATRPLMVADLIPSTTTISNAITYVQEAAWTNAATEIGEGTAKPEATLEVNTVTEAVRKIAVWIPVTDEQLADVPQVRGYLNNRLGFMVRQRLDLQILKGDGTAPNLSGIQDRSDIQTQAKGADPTPDAVYKAMTKIRTVDFSEPNGVVFHPNDWQQIRLLTTADGIYLWGPPMDAGPERIWGLRVVQTTAETEGTALVGDFNQAELAMRQGLTMKSTDSHSTYFILNITVVVAELRAALLVYRPAAFATVTGI